MRSNFPVYDVEQELTEGEPIVSKTDLKGRITYVNPAFLRISGYGEEELLGKAHNIVRHPDMPEEAFADLWQVLKTGQPWTGLVKNRCKNGDFYWVNANVAPIKENGNTVGFMSVRTKPTREQIALAGAFYAQVKNGQAKGWGIRYGSPARNGFLGRLSRISDMSYSTRIAIAMMAIIALFGMNLVAQHDSSFAVAGGLCGMLLAAAAWAGMQSGLTGKLRKSTDTLNALVGGDLSHVVEVNGTGEIRHMQLSFRQLFTNLKASIGDVRGNIISMVASTGEIAHGNMDLARRTEAQAANLRQTAASIKEFSLGVKQNAVNAERADSLAREASTIALRGGDAVAEVGETMGQIHASAGKIRDIITLINEIAFQTNLLALNAAVEAARAGEQGRGFAVVAGEVRSLAQKTGTAATQIKHLIEESTARIETGSQLVQHAGVTVKCVAEAIGKVTDVMSEISTACHQQDIGIDQVNQALDELNDVTQQNAALVEQSATAAANLNAEAEQLQLAVSVFKFDQAVNHAVKVRTEKHIPATVTRLPTIPKPAKLRHKPGSPQLSNNVNNNRPRVGAV